MDDDREIAIPIEITDLGSWEGIIIGILKLKSGNYSVCAYSFASKNWEDMNMTIGDFCHPKNGLSVRDDAKLQKIKEEMTEEIVKNDIYYRYFEKIIN